jgi:hypothetical protein
MRGMSLFGNLRRLTSMVSRRIDPTCDTFLKYRYLKLTQKLPPVRIEILEDPQETDLNLLYSHPGVISGKAPWFCDRRSMCAPHKNTNEHLL